MMDNGDLKDDVKVPEGDLGNRIMKMFKEDEKDTSKRFKPALLTPRICANGVF